MAGNEYTLRSTEEIVAEVLRRVAIKKKERKRKKVIVCSVAAIAGCLLFIALCVVVFTKQGGKEAQAAVHGSAALMGGADVGGYVLAGIIVLTLGVVVALTVKRGVMQTDEKRNVDNKESRYVGGANGTAKTD